MALQYHTELTPETVAEWGDGAGLCLLAGQTLGQGALPRLDADAKRHMADFNREFPAAL